MPTRPNVKEMATLAEPWRPWRAIAARVLWTYYRAVKGREGAPVVQKILPKKASMTKKTSKKAKTLKAKSKGNDGATRFNSP